MKVLERFLKYVSFDTISDPDATGYPSTAHQKVLGSFLVEEMKGIGIADAAMDEYGYVTGTIPAAGGREDAPVLGFIAHMDTSPDLSGKDVKARVIKNYPGGDIVLHKEKNIVMRAAEFDSLEHYIGQDLVVTDGTTLLGGDDKAGIAEIMTMAEYLIGHPELSHGTIKLGFTPDEEVGRGTDYFDIQSFGADYAYTVDGGALGELEYENFNAASAVVTVHGVNIHPGSAKGKMKNSIHIAMEFQGMLPVNERPEFTEGYDGFSHLMDFSGTVEHTVLKYIVRDHDGARFAAKKQRFSAIARYLNEKYGAGTVELTMEDSYSNMKEQIKPHWHLIEIARQAMAEMEVTPITVPIRGGTDGARLSFEGLPCPNLGTGDHNAHGRYEYVCVQSMERCGELLVKIAHLYGQRSK